MHIHDVCVYRLLVRLLLRVVLVAAVSCKVSFYYLNVLSYFFIWATYATGHAGFQMFLLPLRGKSHSTS